MDYKGLDVRVKVRGLVKIVYLLTNSLPENALCSLNAPIQRCVVPTASNNVRVYGRNMAKEKIHFLHVGIGSEYKLETQPKLAADLNHAARAKKLLNGFMNYHKRL